MGIEHAMSLSCLLMGFAFMLQSLEHLRGQARCAIVFFPRLLLSIGLMLAWQQPQWWSYLLSGLVITSLAMLWRYQGPYNGGSDRMGHLLLFSLCLATFLPAGKWQDLVLGYFSIQLILSYFIAGWVKLVNAQWRNGQALQDVFMFSAYPANESLRSWQFSMQLLRLASWMVMLLELAFPLALLSQQLLMLALSLTALFHLSNACFFGFNRFFWIWVSSYPLMFWFQERFILGS